LGLTDLQFVEREKVLAHRQKRKSEALREEYRMLWTIFVILLIMWLLGMVTSYTLGGFIHLLLIIAIAVILIQVIQGRRVV
jgi:asparagine N-glycosylation enzyme membrane subunit Stt3